MTRTAISPRLATSIFLNMTYVGASAHARAAVPAFLSPFQGCYGSLSHPGLAPRAILFRRFAAFRDFSEALCAEWLVFDDWS